MIGFSWVSAWLAKCKHDRELARITRAIQHQQNRKAAQARRDKNKGNEEGEAMTDKPMVAWMPKAQFEKMGGTLEEEEAMTDTPKEVWLEFEINSYDQLEMVDWYTYKPDLDGLENGELVHVMRVKPCPDCANYQRGDPPCDWCKGIGQVIDTEGMSDV